MSKLQAKIEEAAVRFAETIVETIRGLTLEELAGLVGTAGGALPEQKKPAAVPQAKETTAKQTTVQETASHGESAKQRAARKIQGSYIGLLRKFSPKEKLAYKRIARNSGVAAAVDAMKKKLGRA